MEVHRRSDKRSAFKRNEFIISSIWFSIIHRCTIFARESFLAQPIALINVIALDPDDDKFAQPNALTNVIAIDLDDD